MVKEKRKVNWAEVFEAILIGACVAFFSSFLDGISEILKGFGNDTLGGISTTISLLIKRTLS